jgi:hypothetical protein
MIPIAESPFILWDGFSMARLEDEGDPAIATVKKVEIDSGTGPLRFQLLNKAVFAVAMATRCKPHLLTYFHTTNTYTFFLENLDLLFTCCS